MVIGSSVVNIGSRMERPSGCVVIDCVCFGVNFHCVVDIERVWL
jgi:hypothetical protein